MKQELHVRPDGRIKTIEQACAILKRDTRRKAAVTVRLHGGRYRLRKPLKLNGARFDNVTFAAAPGAKPIIDGGEPITGWRETVVNGVKVWVTNVPRGRFFRSLFVNGERRQRPRLPKKGLYVIADVPGAGLVENAGLPSTVFAGSNQFICKPGDIRPWKNLTDVEMVVLHYWVDEHMPVVKFDTKKNLVKSSRRSVFRLVEDWQSKRFARYYVENVFEALTEPGEWYLDRATSKLYYIPRPGETLKNTKMFAPRLTELVGVTGVTGLKFQGITFEHTDVFLPRGGFDPAGSPDLKKEIEYASSPQAAHHVPGVIRFEQARQCAIENCKIRNVGLYAVELADGCMENRIVGNELFDIGAGGVKLGGVDVTGLHALRTGKNEITDNHIHAAGRVFHQAVGILSRHSFGNVIAHNHIHDLFYTGISCGWVWGYAENVSRDNRIEKNHIHDLGHGLLSDMGGIYMLGVQPGTVIRGNVVHDIERATYGGWAIYLDEGSAHIIVENNLGYDVSSQPFHQHYGRENTIRNNIFAFGREGQVVYSRVEPHNGLVVERNIILSDGQPMLMNDYGSGQRRIISDLNLFWDISKRKPVVNQTGKRRLALPGWQALGHDRHSIVADPHFANLKARNFTLAKNSPVLALGFKPFDVSDAGIRTPKARRAK